MTEASVQSRVDEREALVRVAWMYYRDKLTQAQIADRLHVSRATVARMIERAKQQGVVTIEIDTAGVGGMELTGQLRAKYSLDEIVIVPQLGRSFSGESTNSKLAIEGARYLRRYLRPNAVVGVGWGDTVSRTLLELRTESLHGVSFATLTGGIDAYTSRVSGVVNNGIAEYIRFIPSPFLASSREIARALKKEEAVRAVIDLARSADTSIIGIGGAVPNATILQNGIVTEQQIHDFQQQGAVGDILGEWYREDGSLLELAMHDMRVGIEISELRRMRNVIGIAGGIDKLEAIRGALEGKYVDVLITTEDVARDLAK